MSFGYDFETIKKQPAYRAGQTARRLTRREESDKRKTYWGVDLGKPVQYKQPEYTRAYIRNEYKKLDTVNRKIFRLGYTGGQYLPRYPKSKRKRG